VTGPVLRTWASVSLRQLRLNFHSLQQSVGSQVALVPVVKADAYGHGAAAVSRALAGAGAKWLAVSCVSEGIALRQSGITTRILVMGGLLPFEREPVWTHRLTPVVHSLKELREWDQDGRSLAVHLKIDTGMSRLGATASPGETAQALRSLSHIRVEGLMSHFASAEDFTSLQSDEQVRRFEEVWAALQQAGVAPEMRHFSSSNPVVYGRKEAWYSLVRPGLALYGYVSGAVGAAFPAIEVKPVLTWQARLLKVKEIAAGTPVGYMARFRAPCAMRVGTVAAGYADGVPHRLSMSGSLMSEGRALPILGVVSMDLTTVDLTQAPELQEGDAVTILGAGMDAQRIAEIAGEIPYSVLCGIGNRVTRVYSED
jgi:alanine racemase